MMSADMAQIAKDFFEACETGKGWDGCKAYCHDGATFSAQADAIADELGQAGVTTDTLISYSWQADQL